MSGSGERPHTVLRLQVGLSHEAEAYEVADATGRLRNELLELDVGTVEPARGGEPPPGSRAVDFVAIGTLVVGIAKTGLLPPVLGVIHGWLTSNPQRRVRLELDGDVLDLTGVSSHEQRRLTDEWLRRHPGP